MNQERRSRRMEGGRNFGRGGMGESLWHGFMDKIVYSYWGG
jgi:hypothetical protein